MVDFPEIEGIDINPVMVMGKGAVAVDARIVLSRVDERPIRKYRNLCLRGSGFGNREGQISKHRKARTSRSRLPSCDVRTLFSPSSSPSKRAHKPSNQQQIQDRSEFLDSSRIMGTFFG